MSVTVTQSSTPSNESAPPIRPAATRVAAGNRADHRRGRRINHRVAGRFFEAEREHQAAGGGGGGGAGPEETTTAIAVPGATFVFAGSDWLRTVPAAVADVAVVIVPTVSPAVVMAVVAADCVEPTTFGTRAPNATTNATLLPLATFTPAAGLWLMMLPIATVGLFALVTARDQPGAGDQSLRDRLRLPDDIGHGDRDGCSAR